MQEERTIVLLFLLSYALSVKCCQAVNSMFIGRMQL